MENLIDYKEIAELIREKGGNRFKNCYQCGLCDAVCPWNNVRQFSMRKIVRQAFLGMAEIENEEIWRCTTCGSCPSRCPRDVRQIESGMAIRRLASQYGVFPENVKPLRAVSGNLSVVGNPFGEDRETRGGWADDLSVKPYTEEMEYLYFTGCYLSYDRRLKKVARATAAILQKAGVEFGILGSSESCCGESIRKAGDEKLFKELARENIKTFIDSGVKKVIVSSPHCYHTFKNEYPEFMVYFEVIHITQLIKELLDDGRLELKGELKAKIAYHDPCYLGRHNGIYDEPREILAEIPGLELVEMSNSREESLCCGGGGGRIWMDTPKGERFSDIRLGQAQNAGADLLATSCPYCIANFEDSALSLKEEDSIAVMDITEIVAQLL